MDTHLPGPGGRGEELELPTGQETLTALRDGEGGGEEEREWGEWEGVGRRGGNGNFYNLIKLLSKKKKKRKSQPKESNIANTAYNNSDI